jgi:hypothetical protein
LYAPACLTIHLLKDFEGSEGGRKGGGGREGGRGKKEGKRREKVNHIFHFSGVPAQKSDSYGIAYLA